MDTSARTPLVALAESQHGVISRAQLLEAGVPLTTVAGMVRRRVLRPVFRGVYAWGHAALRDEGWWLAAVLACGDGAVLSHHSAARAWGMWLPAGVDERAVHVTTRGRVLEPAGLVVHRSRTLTGADVARRGALRVTTPARTVLDQADLLSFEEVRALLDRGVRIDPQALRRAFERSPGRRGAPTIRRLLAAGDVATRSMLERRVLRLCREHGLPRPAVNVRLLGRERDFAWPEQRVVLEADGHGVHAPRGARERDHVRDSELVLGGWRVMRATYDQVFHEPRATGRRLAALLFDGGVGD